RAGSRMTFHSVEISSRRGFIACLRCVFMGCIESHLLGGLPLHRNRLSKRVTDSDISSRRTRESITEKSDPLIRSLDLLPFLVPIGKATAASISAATAASISARGVVAIWKKDIIGGFGLMFDATPAGDTELWDWHETERRIQAIDNFRERIVPMLEEAVRFRQ